MASRPRRTAMTRANEAIANESKDSVSKNSEREQVGTKLLRHSRSRINTRGASRASSGSSSSQHLDIGSSSKMPASKLRHVTGAGGGQVTVNRRDHFAGGEIIDGKRNRGGKKSYVVESDSDSEMGGDDNDGDEEMGDAEMGDAEMGDAETGDAETGDAEDGEDDEDDEDDAEGEEDDADEVDFISSPQPAPPAIKIPKAKVTPSPAKFRPGARPSARAVLDDDEDEDDNDDDDDDDEDGDGDDDEDDDDLSDPESDMGNETYGDQTLVDEDDAEGEEDDDEDGDDDPNPDMMALAEDDAEGEDDEDVEEEPDSEGGMSRAGTPDLSKMTRRQRARFEDAPQQHMKLSDEVQVKKHFTAEELSMRRAEMARRRRNLSEKRNEEVKMETINKLLKRQAPKTKGKANAGEGEDGDGEGARPNPSLVRWVNTRAGSRIAVPAELASGPAGAVFGGPSLGEGRKLIEEVS